ncbi:hypothetical protein SASPL_120653 [Salvia splendens]|uniref:non-specific serine/threonine protein kinase n=1 Tax=Salvia splendens TaxID=180675 RepID=A0A8X8XTH6_SALSN|nr:hypothetical protein SASPL_120653 [Salvia splendens]
MTRSFSGIISATILLLFSVIPPPPASALGGSAATIAAVYGSSTTVCSIAANQAIQQIQCWRDGQLLPPILPTVSFDYLAGGRDTLCAVRSGGLSLLCWNTTFAPKRIYNTSSAPLTSLAIGDAQICALRNTTSDSAICWRGNSVPIAQFPDRFRMISSGLRFSCGVTETTNRVLCWGDGGGDDSSSSVQSDFSNLSMFSIYVGGNHACGIDVSRKLICGGSNDNGQLDIPYNTSGDYRDLALGASHTCAITRSNGSVVCWGGDDREFSSSITDGISFESIVAGFNFTCGLTRRDFSVVCWGAGWPTSAAAVNNLLPLQKTLPGPCVQTPCSCGEYPDYETLCVGNGHICAPCDPISANPSLTPPSPPPRSSRPSRGLRRGLLAFAIVGSVGGFAGICSVVYCLWRSGCFGKKKVHNSVQPTITNSAAAAQSGSNPPSRSSTLRRQASILMRRQRSGTSSKQHADKAEEFLFSDLAEATRNFAAENRIGAGSFGVVYRGKLPNGREVAIKRSELGSKAKKFQDKENAFESEISRVGAAEVNEIEAVELVAYTAMHCVHLEGKDRPSMSDIIINLDRALGLCEDSHGSISSGTISD